jgi:transposase
MVPWADPMSWFTHAFEQTVGYLAQESSKTVVSTMMRASPERSARSSVAWSKDASPRQARWAHAHRRRRAVIPEAHHKYVTIVVDHKSGRVVWGA